MRARFNYKLWFITFTLSIFLFDSCKKVVVNNPTIPDSKEPNPIAGFAFEINDHYAPAKIKMVDMSYNAKTYSWNFGDGESSIEADPEHTYKEAGEYIATLIVSNNATSDTIADTISIQAVHTYLIFSGIASTTDTVGCEPLTVNFNICNPVSGYLYKWNFGDVNSAYSNFSNLPNPVHIYYDAGTYSVGLMITDTYGIQTNYTATDIIHVDVIPQCDFYNYPSITSILHAEINFINTSTDAVSYFWNFGDGSTSTETSPKYRYTTEDTFTVVLVVNSAMGCMNHMEQSVLITGP